MYVSNLYATHISHIDNNHPQYVSLYVYYAYSLLLTGIDPR